MGLYQLAGIMRRHPHTISKLHRKQYAVLTAAVLVPVLQICKRCNTLQIEYTVCESVQMHASDPKCSAHTITKYAQHVCGGVWHSLTCSRAATGRIR